MPAVEGAGLEDVVADVIASMPGWLLAECKDVLRLNVISIDRLGYFGHSTACGMYTLAKPMYYFESCDDGKPMATALQNRIRPMLRVCTTNKVKPL